MGPETIDGTAAAFVAGLATSLHCMGMCGPLACGLGTMGGGERERRLGAVLYHGGRALSYAGVGAVVGWLGGSVLAGLTGGPAAVLPWFLAAALLVYGFGLERKLPRPAFLVRETGKWRLRLSRLPARYGGLGLGLATPLLPCGPLYLMFGIALLSGSAWRGAETLFAFALGTLPLLWMGQYGFRRLQGRLAPRGMAILRRSVAVTAGFVLVWRLRETLWFADPTGPPSCCL